MNELFVVAIDKFQIRRWYISTFSKMSIPLHSCLFRIMFFSDCGYKRLNNKYSWPNHFYYHKHLSTCDLCIRMHGQEEPACHLFIYKRFVPVAQFLLFLGNYVSSTYIIFKSEYNSMHVKLYPQSIFPGRVKDACMIYDLFGG